MASSIHVHMLPIGAVCLCVGLLLVVTTTPTVTAFVSVAPIPVADCTSVKDQVSCDNSTVNSTYCCWCKAAAVPSACYSCADTPKLPKSIFQCDLPPAAPATIDNDKTTGDAPVADCGELKDQVSCDASAVNGTACVWCKSAAVPSACYLSSDASKLPPSIFACDK